MEIPGATSRPGATRISILHVFKDAYPPTHGGVEQHIWAVARGLLPEFDSTVLTSSRSLRHRQEIIDGIRFLRTAEYGRVLSTPVTPSWLFKLRASTATVVHQHIPNPFGEVAWLTSGVTSPLVVSFSADVMRNPRLARCYSVLQHRFLARADRIVVSSERLAATSPALAGLHGRTVVIPFGVDADEWPSNPERTAEIQRSTSSPIVLFLGRLVHYKGVDVLIDAMQQVDATLFIVGDGPRRPALERAAREAGLGTRVRFVGRVDDEERAAYYRAAAVFVLPSVSRAETFGIAMLEAMALGTPVISTEVGTGTSWVNTSGETGLVVPPRSSTELARALIALLGDDARRAGMGEAAARRAREHFPKRAMLHRLADLYRSVAGRSAPAGRGTGE